VLIIEKIVVFSGQGAKDAEKTPRRKPASSDEKEKRPRANRGPFLLGRGTSTEKEGGIKRRCKRAALE
jgi:hypothetical protein